MSDRDRLILLVGPSGAGKSTIAGILCPDLDLVHLDADVDRAFKLLGLRDAWPQFRKGRNAAPLAETLRLRASGEGQAGTLLSLPSTRKSLLDPDHVRIARAAGIRTVVLWGAEAFCKRARRLRDAELGISWQEARYDEWNAPTFELYGRPEYDPIRIEVFEPDGTRRSPTRIVADIRSLVSV